MSDKDDLIYDEDDSVAFIQNYLPQELKGKFSNDDINYIVDLIYEFYESKGFLDENSDDNAEIDIDEEAAEAYKEIMNILNQCNSKQLASLKNISMIYADMLKRKV